MLPWYLPLDVILTYKNVYLLKGKYPQLQVLQPPFPSEGVTLDQLRGLHVNITKAGVSNTVSSVLKNKHT
jgi:hypothetical protein